MRVLLPLFLLALTVAGCQNDRADRLLLGEWEGIAATHAGDSLALDPTEVGFTFLPSNRYSYRSTLEHREAGTFRYEAGHLYASDTTHQGDERVVAVDLLTRDSLVLRMRADSAFNILTLRRTSQPPE